MPLTRASARFVMRQDDLHFLMKDGEAEVVCAISARVLLAIGKAAGMTNPVCVDYEVRTIEERDLTLSEQSAQSARPPRQ
jgi:hypothetical protein